MIKKILNSDNLIITSLMIFFGIFVNGLMSIKYNDILKFTYLDIYALLVLLILAILFLRFITKINYIAVFIIIIIGLSILFGALGPLMTVVFITISSYCLGFILIKILSKYINCEQIPLIILILIGFAIFGMLTNIFANFPINYPGLYGLIFLIPLILNHKNLVEFLKNFNNYFNLNCHENLKDHFFMLLILLLIIAYFLISLMPEIGHDALAAHLFIPSFLAENHRWEFNPELYVWALMPSLGDWIYSMAFMLGGEQAARLINTEFILILVLLIREMVLWAKSSNSSANIAILVFLTTPLTFLENSSLYIDSIWAAFIIGGSLLVFKFIKNEQNRSALVILSGIMFGAASSAKAVTFTIIPILFVIIFVDFIFSKQKNVKIYIYSLILFIIFGSLPYITAYLKTGNPFFPFFNDIFQSPLWPSTRFDSPIYGKGVDWNTLYEITFNSGSFLEASPGATGFQMLLFLIPATLILFSSKNKNGLLILFIALSTAALCFQATAYLRYVFPSFIWFSVVMGITYFEASKGTISLKMIFFSMVAFVVVANLFFLRSATNYGSFSIKALLSKNNLDEYIDNRLPIRNLVTLVNQLNKNNFPVPFFSAPLAAGLKADALHPNWYNIKFQSLVFSANTKEKMAKVLDDYGVNYLILDSNWKPSDKAALVAESTLVVAERGALSVRAINRDYLYSHELLKNPDFKESVGWVGSLKKYSGFIEVTAESPTIQAVNVIAGRKYLNSVVSRCANDLTQGRVQINWMDSDNKFIKTDIKVFNCTMEERLEKMIVTAPSGAKTAVVFATSHSKVPILVSAVSLKE